MGSNNLKFFSNQQTETLLTTQLTKQLSLRVKLTDEADPLVKKNRWPLKQTHFYYTQSIRSIPVYHSALVIHVDANGNLSAIDGRLIDDWQLPNETISEDAAISKAMTTAASDFGANLTQLSATIEGRYIINLKLLGLDDNDNNYLTLAVRIDSGVNLPLFSRMYFVDLTTGQIVYKEDRLIAALNRIIKRCNSSGSGCTNVRTEGQPPVNNTAANTTYDILGDIYNFFYLSFGLDSYNGRGSPIVAVVNFSNPTCPNAFADPENHWIYICSGMNTPDIVAHEYTHLVNENRFVYQRQSGALNEALADIFAYGIDNKDWTCGEGSTVGVVRRIDNPPAKQQPDRLFSSLYQCGSQDNGFVHINGGVIAKSFYLMVAGGSFNGCMINGIGHEKVFPVIYRAVTTYLVTAPNFFDYYQAVNRACNDIYGANSFNCININNAMKAVEIDQQPQNTQLGPRCLGESRKPVSCQSVGNPTVSPTSPPNITNLPTTTTVPTLPVLSPTLSPTQPQIPTITSQITFPVESPTMSPTIITGNVQLDMILKFQGISRKPVDPLNLLKVKIAVVSDNGNQQSIVADFTSSDNGLWYGKVNLFVDLSGNPSFKVLVKGPKHLQKRICDLQPQEIAAGYYQCNQGKIKLHNGSNQLNFSQIYLLAGDLPEQDGVVNAADVSLIRNSLGLTVNTDHPADVNLDGKIDTQDYSLVIQTLMVRFDE